MKKRGIIIASFLLLAVLVMGVGFAALTDNLFIKGEATIATTSAQSNFDEDVYFIAADEYACTGSNTTTDSAVVGATDKDSATFYVKSLGNQGEQVTFVFTIKNESTEFDASISLDTGFPSNTNTEYFTVTYSIEADGVANTGPIVCAAGGTVDVYVTVVLNKSPSENVTAAFNVNLTATSQPKATTGV